MKVLIVGGDNIRSILDKLQQKGFNDIVHINGRKGGDKKICTLLKVENADLVIILVDYVNHSVVRNTKEKIKNSNAKAIFSKRSWLQLESPINNFMALQRNV
jgi:hypothetical protein